MLRFLLLLTRHNTIVVVVVVVLAVIALNRKCSTSTTVIVVSFHEDCIQLYYLSIRVLPLNRVSEKEIVQEKGERWRVREKERGER